MPRKADIPTLAGFVSAPSDSVPDPNTMVCFCTRLRQVTRAVTQRYDRDLQPSGLLITQVSVLVAISRAEFVPISALAEVLVMDRTTLTRNLGPLEKQGLLKVVAGKDRRTRYATLTAEGQKTLAEVAPLWEQTQNQLIEGLGKERWDAMLEHMSAVLALTW
ncbi:MarR family winged helix-turn-helix transcriptional regulator [Anthocerotibacter panamensis]|uniref:MarR family winged helix-turn-helix transcriptional regulator n=1 Tax=Anthocerotibacter panamensis TaxID=2857077 RepID=UPI001C40158A|nr:MarR family winged helix-turn-helix transcriptional regulator [Anthocerotibacter panamensis]